MPHRLASFPQFDAFTSPNEGEDRRYVLARTAVLQALVQGPTIKPVFVRWEKTTNLNKLAAAVAVTGDRLAKTLGLANRGQLSQQHITIHPQDRRAVKDNAAREKAIAQFKKQLSAIPKALHRDAVQAAKTLQLPWLWVIQGLVRAYVLQCGAVAVGFPFALSQTVEPTPITLTVPASTNNRKVLALVQAARRARRDGSRMPKRKVEVIARNARWFVRHEIDGVPIAELAREHHAAYHGDIVCENDRALVQRGIRETKRLLDLTQYRLK